MGQIGQAHQNLAQLDPQLQESILSNAKNFVCFRLDRGDAELLIKYIMDIDPFAWKYRAGDDYDWYTINEQWEQGITEVTNLDTQVAILKTKGSEPTFFRTYDLEDYGLYEQHLAEAREKNLEQGFTSKLSELDDALPLQILYDEKPTIPQLPDEPESFVE